MVKTSTVGYLSCSLPSAETVFSTGNMSRCKEKIAGIVQKDSSRFISWQGQTKGESAVEPVRGRKNYSRDMLILCDVRRKQMNLVSNFFKNI